MKKSIKITVFILGVLACLGSSFSQTIFEAAEKGDLEAVKKLIEADPSLVQAKTDAGETALFPAAAGGHLEIVRFLLERGAPIDILNANRQNALLYAAFEGHKEIVTLFLAKGANLSIKDRFGRTALHYAAREGRPEVVEILLKNGGDLSLRDQHGMTPPDYAVLRNQTDIIFLLVKKGLVNLKEQNGVNLLHIAAAQGNEKLVKYFLEKGAAPALKSWSGDTLLQSFIQGSLVEYADKWISYGADINAQNQAGKTPLHFAVERDLDDIIALLLKKGANPNLADKEGRFPINIAMDWGDGETVEFLKEHGAKIPPNRVYLLQSDGNEIAEHATKPSEKEVAIRYMCNEGFLITTADKKILIDSMVQNPWGYANTPKRAWDMMQKGQLPFDGIDLLLFSHAHRDHFEPEMALDFLSAHPETVLVGDGIVLEELQTANPEKCQALSSRLKNPDVSIGKTAKVEVNGIPLRVLGVNHAFPDQPYLTLGYILELEGLKIYHQGDIYPDSNIPFLKSINWEEEKIDIAFLDPFFFNSQQALDIVREQIRPKAIILMHMRDAEVEGYLETTRKLLPNVMAFRESMEKKIFAKAN